MMHNGHESGAVKAITAFMRPYAKQFKKLEKDKRAASEWNGRAVLRAEQMGGAAGQSENAKKAQEASANASGALDKMSISIMVAYHRQFEGWEFRSLGEMNAAISDEETGTGKAVSELGEALSKEKNMVSRYFKLPLAVAGLATLVFCAISKHITAAGIMVVAGAGFATAIASAAVNSVFSRREAALATWEKAAARVNGLVKDGNGDDMMDALREEAAVGREISGD